MLTCKNCLNPIIPRQCSTICVSCNANIHVDCYELPTITSFLGKSSYLNMVCRDCSSKLQATKPETRALGELYKRIIPIEQFMKQFNIKKFKEEVIRECLKVLQEEESDSEDENGHSTPATVKNGTYETAGWLFEDSREKKVKHPKPRCHLKPSCRCCDAYKQKRKVCVHEKLLQQ